MWKKGADRGEAGLPFLTPKQPDGIQTWRLKTASLQPQCCGEMRSWLTERERKQVQNTRTEDSCMSVTDEECGLQEAVKKKERGTELKKICSCGRYKKVRQNVLKRKEKTPPPAQKVRRCYILILWGEGEESDDACMLYNSNVIRFQLAEERDEEQNCRSWAQERKPIRWVVSWMPGPG